MASQASSSPCEGAVCALAAPTPVQHHEHESVYTCGVCLGIVVENLQCITCKHLFCVDCLENWLKSETGNKLCPTCRADASDPEKCQFVRNEDLIAAAAKFPYICEHACGATCTLAERGEHLKVCPALPIVCPYVGCGAVSPRSEMDQHTFSCPYSRQYNAEAILARMAAAARDSSAADHDELYHAAARHKAQAGPARTGPDGTAIHHVARHDTLAGIALRYDTTVAEIRRLNRLFSDNVHSYATLLVPAPPETSECAKAMEPPVEPPAEVVLALYRKQLVRQIMSMASIGSDEAIAYLRLAKYNVTNALAEHKAAQEWAAAHPFKPARTLKDFVRQQREREHARRPGCHGCKTFLDEKRAHCPACGAIFCNMCVIRAGHFSHSIPRGALGVTGPASSAPLPVCMHCISEKTAEVTQMAKKKL